MSERPKGPFGIDPLHFSIFLFSILILFVLYLLLPRGFRKQYFGAYPKRHAWSARIRSSRRRNSQGASYAQVSCFMCSKKHVKSSIMTIRNWFSLIMISCFLRSLQLKGHIQPDRRSLAQGQHLLGVVLYLVSNKFQWGDNIWGLHLQICVV
jgi:hypothetical protein